MIATLPLSRASEECDWLSLNDTYTLDWKGILSDSDLKFVGFDIETNGVDPYKCPQDFQARGFSLAVKLSDGSVCSDYFPVSHTRGENLHPDDWRPILQAALAKTVIVHNFYTADGKFVEAFGESIGDFYDTLKLCHLENENFTQSAAGYSLDGCSMRYLKREGKRKSLEFQMMLQLVGWEGLSFKNVREYAAYDAATTLELFFAL